MIALHVDQNPFKTRQRAVVHTDALSNLVAVLELAADGQVRCTASRCPSVSAVKLIEDVLVAGDYYEGGEAIAAVLGGQTPISFGSIAPAAPMAQNAMNPVASEKPRKRRSR